MSMLIFVACLVGAPDRCEERTLAFDVTPLTCMMSAQSTLAQWNFNQPAWRIARWRCSESLEVRI